MIVYLLSVSTLLMYVTAQDHITYVLEDPFESRLAIATWNNVSPGHMKLKECKLYGDRDIIKILMEDIPSSQVMRVTRFGHWKEMCASVSTDLSGRISILSQPSGNQSFKKIRVQRTFILPGTKWCGAGNVANDFQDLGKETDVDKCCRNHDNCADSIPGGKEKYGLKNKDVFTRSHCECDSNFRSCLMSASSRTADICGDVYFNVLQVKCFQRAPPVSNCKEYRNRGFGRSCQNYELNSSQPEVWQFFDSKFYEPLSFKGP